ncbi:helix-turn-helix domain-containing protein [Candidatus Thiodictyon syntrophicum]|jgi:transcriptional regulator with XRE-family HTH domain|uniref:HTH cro/C1-type domain-containing protein n=1 Tax=Candidatus Thiodictyon syntrophicum TaxID=1166950 RepID=A0A2K8U948_9GAMM|nr:helix-turn-helix transcriptional regulator [Candidatus Thiodictyon syntrophicum]AUB81939.1 hypothetical protein THSYN_13880 [Candidatus Thiodictyon syntrophicum]
MNNAEKIRLIGRNLRRARKLAGLTQTELGALVGIGQSYVGQIERSEKNVTLEVLVKLCTAIGIEVGDLTRMAPTASDAPQSGCPHGDPPNLLESTLPPVLPTQGCAPGAARRG